MDAGQFAEASLLASAAAAAAFARAEAGTLGSRLPGAVADALLYAARNALIALRGRDSTRALCTLLQQHLQQAAAAASPAALRPALRHWAPGSDLHAALAACSGNRIEIPGAAPVLRISPGMC